ncbi:MAG: dTDP-4-dehydrorhamnose 3,5-epimerase, partial [Bacteroidales bacterium]|nr:dTDP-4-dehydrorhamnose 3,5-epimerase [Bacteroidales bacterium]
MTVTDTFIKDLKIIEPKVFGDQRGYFFETWNKSVFDAAGINFVPVQQNESSSTYGVVRGLHFQLNPYSQAKLVRCVVGKVLDVAVDVRKGSPTFGKHISVELSEENKRQFLIPRGFAHGFSVLSDYAVFAYLCDNAYNK